LLPDLNFSAVKTTACGVHRREIVISLNVQEVHDVPIWANSVGAVIHGDLQLGFR
jgi:hypothetical protein